MTTPLAEPADPDPRRWLRRRRVAVLVLVALLWAPAAIGLQFLVEILVAPQFGGSRRGTQFGVLSTANGIKVESEVQPECDYMASWWPHEHARRVGFFSTHCRPGGMIVARMSADQGPDPQTIREIRLAILERLRSRGEDLTPRAASSLVEDAPSDQLGLFLVGSLLNGSVLVLCLSPIWAPVLLRKMQDPTTHT